MLGPTMITTPVSNGWLYPAQTPTTFWEREAEKKQRGGWCPKAEDILVRDQPQSRPNVLQLRGLGVLCWQDTRMLGLKSRSTRSCQQHVLPSG